MQVARSESFDVATTHREGIGPVRRSVGHQSLEEARRYADRLRKVLPDYYTTIVCDGSDA